MKYWIWLSRIQEINDKEKQILIEKYKNPKELYNLNVSELLNNGLNTLQAQGVINIKYKKGLDFYLDYINKNEINIVTIKDKRYPKILKNIYDYPLVLYVKGNANILNELYVAIIGSRLASDYGKKVSYKLSYELAINNINIISGMARGIDTYAHLGCIKANGKTLAVLGSGLDNIYPPENKKLYEQIIKTGGAVISEFFIGTKPIATNFPKRNRIISGMSKGVIIVEAKQKSGTFITTDFALEQGKEIYAVPGNITSLNSVGTNELIKQGAKLITNIEDVLYDINNIKE